MTDRTDKTAIGDRMKRYEEPSTSRKAFKGQPIVVRLDGNNFHTFTKGLKRPYDENLSHLMVSTARALVERFHCDIAYTQSDEITLVFLSEPDGKSDLLFDGRFQKIETLTASYATAHFNKFLPGHLPQKAHLLPCFDSRAYVVPNVQEAYHAILWRQQDATKNAISMGAQALFSQKELDGKNGPQLREMMLGKGVQFEDYPYFFKRGTFVKRVSIQRELTEAELAKIPEQHRPSGPVSRTEVIAFDLNLPRLGAHPTRYVFGAAAVFPAATFSHWGHTIEVHGDGEVGFHYSIPSMQVCNGVKFANIEDALVPAMEMIDIRLGDFTVA